MSDSLYTRILAEQQAETETDGTVRGRTFLVFKTDSEHYAIDSTEVKEIVRNTECYPMPFMPPYVKGVLNNYGSPFAVVDLSLFLGDAETSNPLFLVLKSKSNVALQVSEIQEFHNESDVTYQNFADEASGGGFFLGTISFDILTAPVLNTRVILGKVRSDLEKI